MRYQGEELGFTEAQIEQHQLQDPFGIEFWPEFKGRDGCRTPMAWDNSAPLGGFSCSQAWLPVSNAHLDNSVKLQHNDAGSVLNFYRAFLSWRRGQDCLSQGSINFVDSPDQLLAFIREHNGTRILAAFNISDQSVNWVNAQSKDCLLYTSPSPRD